MLCVAHAQHELHVVRTRMNDEGTRETAATVRHEREQGDEKRESERTKCRPPLERKGDRDRSRVTRFVAHAQHEFAHGSRSKRESSTWFARAGGGRDET